MKRPLFRPEYVPAALVVAAVGAGSLESHYFLDVRYLLDSSSLYVETGLLALGMTLVIVAGEIDLSVGATMAFAAAVLAKAGMAGWSPAACVAAAVTVGLALGAINGLLVARLSLPSFMVTLATMAGFRGAAHVLLGAESANVPPGLIGADMTVVPGLGIPLPLVVLIVATLVFWLLLHRTVFGRYLFAVGTNEVASRFSGLPTRTVKLRAFMLSGLMAGLAGVLIDSRLGVARYDHGQGLELDAITAVVLGGASIYGGTGSIAGTILALALLALIRIGMGVANVPPEYQLAVVGTLLIVALLVGNIGVQWSSRRKATSGETGEGSA